MDVSVIIVNYNTVSMTLQCVESIFKYSRSLTFEIIVIDNNSTDNSCAIIKKEFSEVIIISNSENVGFGRANNLGIANAKGKYLFFLNSDTVLLNDSIKIFFDFMERKNSNGDIGAIGCVMFDRNMQLNFRNSFYTFPGVKMLYSNLYNGFLKISKNYSDKHNSLIKDGKLSVDFIVGADLFIPRNILDRIGVFDPSFFLYWEEVDLQYRMHKMNLKRLIIDGPQIIHLEGGSTKNTIKNWQRIMDTESLIKYMRKHKNVFSVLLVKTYFIICALSAFRKRIFTMKEHIIYFKKILIT